MKRAERGGKTGRNRLSGGFEKISAERWKKAIEREIGDGGYEKKLVWKPGDGLAVEPFGCPEDTAGLSLFPAPAPGNFPFTRESCEWKICEDIPMGSVSAAAKLAREGTAGGADWALFRGKVPETAEGFEKLLSEIDPSENGACFAPAGGGVAAAAALADFAEKSGLRALRGFILCDPLGAGAKGEVKRLAKLLPRFEKALPGYGCVGIGGARFRDAGATVAEETAFSLALGAEYLTVLGENGVPVRAAAEAAVFHFSAGSVFFMEAAKLRAARAVWAHIVERFDRGASGRMRIHSSASAVNKSVCDPEVNILRAAGEAMAAVVGGCGSLSIPAFDGGYGADPEKSRAVARNTQLILREECGLDRVADPCGGSYYAEVLTEKLAETALGLFQEIEKRGGFLKCLEDGFIKDRLERSRRARDARVASGEEPLIGVNRYPIEGEAVSERLKKRKGPPVAGAAFERMRAAAEKHARGKGGRFPSVFLVKTGDPAARSARAAFSTNFFAAGGFRVTDGGVFDSAAEAAEAAVKSRADVFVLCSEDARYPEFAPPFAEKAGRKRKNAVIVAAGAPAGEKAAGIDLFINSRSNILKTLKETAKMCGVGKRTGGGKK